MALFASFIALTALLLSLAVPWHGFLTWQNWLNNPARDYLSSISAPKAPNDVALVLVSQPNWQLKHYVQLSNILLTFQPKAVVLDVYPSAHTPKEQQQDLQYLLQQHKNVFIGQAQINAEKRSMAVTATKQQGIVNILPDADGRLRHYPETILGMPTLAARVLPTTHPTHSRLQWYQRQKTAYGLTHPYYLAETLLKQPSLIKNFKNKIIVIGAYGIAYHDTVASPMSPWHVGADVHATALSNRLNHHSASVLAEWSIIQQGLWGIFLLLLSLSTLALSLQARPRWIVLGNSLLPAGLILSAWGIACHSGALLDVGSALLVWGVSLMAGLWGRSRLYQQKSEHLYHTLERVINPLVLLSLGADENDLTPTMRPYDITSVFVDLREFVSLSQHMPTSALTDMLNSFYKIVETAVIVNQGTLDKFMGDGVLAFFGAPLQAETHPQQALQAAMAIQKALQHWQPQLNFGITLASGPAQVGFVGQMGKLEYTAIGDCVNLTARLQEVSKALQQPIILSDTTVQGLPDVLKSQCQPSGLVHVRGVSEPMAIWHLMMANALTNPTV